MPVHLLKGFELSCAQDAEHMHHSRGAHRQAVELCVVRGRHGEAAALCQGLQDCCCQRGSLCWVCPTANLCVWLGSGARRSADRGMLLVGRGCSLTCRELQGKLPVRNVCLSSLKAGSKGREGC